MNWGQVIKEVDILLYSICISAYKKSVNSFFGSFPIRIKYKLLFIFGSKNLETKECHEFAKLSKSSSLEWNILYFCDMRQALVISLSIVLIFPAFQQVGVLAFFKLNQSTIIQNWCENKQEPELKCNGKCYLAKRMQASKPAPVKPAPLPEVQEPVNLVLYLQTSPSNDWRDSSVLRDKPFKERLLTEQLYSSRLLRPPIFGRLS